MEFLTKLKHARNAGAPLVSITTADQQACLASIVPVVNGDSPAIVWDVARGVREVNALGRPVAKKIGPDPIDLGALLGMAIGNDPFPSGTVLFVMVPEGFTVDPVLHQAIENCRDEFKRDGRMIVLLSKSLELKGQIADDAVVLDEPLPSPEELKAIVERLDKGFCDQHPGRKGLDKETTNRVVDALTGLNAFSAETVFAMASRKIGVDLDLCFDRKVATIEATHGLTVYRQKPGCMTFDDLGGLDQAKEDVTMMFNGPRRPKVVLWIDELEKTGVAARGDSAGVNRSAEGKMLQWMQQRRAYGMMLLGVAGSGKSALCEAIAGEFGVLVIQLDFDALLGSLVGESQANLRNVLKVVDAVGGDRVLILATCNSNDDLSAAMKSRFTDVYFFDEPSRKERVPIWEVWMRKNGLDSKTPEDDEGFNGRNIYQACDKAVTMGIPLDKAVKKVVPAGIAGREDAEKLRMQADGRYLSASYNGVYEMTEKQKAVETGRKINLE